MRGATRNHMNDGLFAYTRVRDVATGEVRVASEWQRLIVQRDGVSPFEAWAHVAEAIVARRMTIERPRERDGPDSSEA